MKKIFCILVFPLTLLLWASSPVFAEKKIAWELLEGEWSRTASAEGEMHIGTAIFSKEFAPFHVQLSLQGGTVNRKVEIIKDGTEVITTNKRGDVRSRLRLKKGVAGTPPKLVGEYKYHSGWGDLKLVKERPPKPRVLLVSLDMLRDLRFEGTWKRLRGDNTVRGESAFALYFDGQEGVRINMDIRGNTRRWSPNISFSHGELILTSRRKPTTYTFRLFKKTDVLILRGWGEREGRLTRSILLSSQLQPKTD